MSATIHRLDELAWYQAAGWARRRARLNADRRRCPFAVVWHPERGFASVRLASLALYDTSQCRVVEEVVANNA